MRQYQHAFGCSAMILGISLSIAPTGYFSRLMAQDQPTPQQRAEPSRKQEFETLTRGPVHEAFAAPLVFDPKPSIRVPQAPPDAIEEIPPDQKPAGENVMWIPGYWNWDDEHEKFIWISGIWRVVPPNMEWVPGYWAKADGGYQYVSGFWRPIAEDEVNYLPTPPATVEAGPIGDSPSVDDVWIPGNWLWRDTRYVWRQGYYTQCRHGWIWIPASYVWTPGGYVFVDGYWDYSVRRRGVLFAPLAFAPGFYPSVGFGFSPSVVINTDLFTNYLFVNAFYRQYYFGDYYNSQYLSLGIYPWFTFTATRYGFDPIYAYYGWHNDRYDRRWRDRIRDDYWHRRDNQDARPPRTFAALTDRGNTNVGGTNLALGTELGQFASQSDSAMRFETLGESRRQEMTAEAKQLNTIRDGRIQAESRANLAKPELGKPHLVKLPKSAIAAKAVAQANSDSAPPAKPQIPLVDLNKEGRPPEEQQRGRPKFDPNDVLPERPKSAAKSRPPEVAPDKPKDLPRAVPPVPKPEPKTPRVEPKPEPRVPRTNPKPEPRPSRPEPLVPKVEPRPEPRPPRVEPPAAAKVEPKPEPLRVAPQRPKLEPRPEPKPPRVEPKPPRIQPMPERPRETLRPSQVQPAPQQPREAPRPPRIQPTPERPRETLRPSQVQPAPQQPREAPRPPRIQPTPERPHETLRPSQVQPAPQWPREAPRPPHVQPVPERPREAPKPPHVQPTPERPRGEPNPPKAERRETNRLPKTDRNQDNSLRKAS